jgi:hypothetical protein
MHFILVLSFNLYQELYAIFALETEEGTTSRHVVVRRHHSGTLTLNHYHVDRGGNKGDS